MKRKVIRAEVYGFCSGVRRAVDLAIKAANDGEAGQVHTLGQLVHNPRIMEMLKKRGVTPIDSPDAITEATVVIRAHGAPAGTVSKLRRRGVNVIDATCPKVARSHEIIDSYAKRGYHVVIAGERNHDEVQGLLSHAGSATVVESAAEAAELDCCEPLILIAQTTFRAAEFDRIYEAIKARFEKVELFQTICPAMEKRCNALNKLVREVEAVVVIGGKNSANTRRLFEQAAQAGLPAWQIEEMEGLPDEVFGFETIGLTAGASTPDYVVDEVQRRLETEDHPGSTS